MADDAPRPSQPPTSFAADVFDKFLSDIALKVGIPRPQASKFVPGWRWIGSIGEYDGVAKGGLRDILDALVKHVNRIKDVDIDPMKTELVDHETRITRLEEAPAARPFP